MKLFVAFSHQLTQGQINGFKMQYGDLLDGCHAEDPQGYDVEIVSLKDSNPELQAAMSAIPATAALKQVQTLAKKIVTEAIWIGATHFFCTGEPTLTMWANLYASGNGGFDFSKASSMVAWSEFRGGVLKCIQSTTERKSSEVVQPDGTVKKTQIFNHVQWREMF